MKSKTASVVGKTTFWPFGLLKSDAILANIRFGATPGYHCGRCDGRRERMGGGLSVGQLCLPRTSAASQAHALENALANGGHHRGRKLHAPTARGLRGAVWALGLRQVLFHIPSQVQTCLRIDMHEPSGILTLKSADSYDLKQAYLECQTAPRLELG